MNKKLKYLSKFLYASLNIVYFFTLTFFGQAMIYLYICFFFYFYITSFFQIHDYLLEIAKDLANSDKPGIFDNFWVISVILKKVATTVLPNLIYSFLPYYFLYLMILLNQYCLSKKEIKEYFVNSYGQDFLESCAFYNYSQLIITIEKKIYLLAILSIVITILISCIFFYKSRKNSKKIGTFYKIDDKEIGEETIEQLKIIRKAKEKELAELALRNTELTQERNALELELKIKKKEI